MPTALRAMPITSFIHRGRRKLTKCLYTSTVLSFQSKIGPGAVNPALLSPLNPLQIFHHAVGENKGHKTSQQPYPHTQPPKNSIKLFYL